jgi:hypothetical protein
MQLSEVYLDFHETRSLGENLGETLAPDLTGCAIDY